MNARSRAESHRSLLKLDLRASGRFPAREESLSLVLWIRRIERPPRTAASSAPANLNRNRYDVALIVHCHKDVQVETPRTQRAQPDRVCGGAVLLRHNPGFVR